MLNLLKILNARMGEPSTYASIAILLAAGGHSMDAGTLQTIANYGVVVAAALGVLISEAGDKKPALQIAEDVAKAAVAGIKAMPAVATMLALLALGSLTACTQAQVAQVQTDVAVGCAVAPELAATAPASVQVAVKTGCADAAVLAPVVAPLVTAPVVVAPVVVAPATTVVAPVAAPAK